MMLAHRIGDGSFARMNEPRRKYKLSSFPGMPRFLRRQLIAALNKGEPSKKLTETERAAARAEREKRAPEAA